MRLVSLQKNYGLAQLETRPQGMAVETLGDRFDDGDNAFFDSAAAMASLDLVITCDTSIAHLAGALGVKVWTALKFVPDFRWGIGGEETPWYASMRLFRQSSPGDWTGVFDAMREALEQELS